jgi:hypothetical protein
MVGLDAFSPLRSHHPTAAYSNDPCMLFDPVSRDLLWLTRLPEKKIVMVKQSKVIAKSRHRLI